jgi:hypothetical protein
MMGQAGVGNVGGAVQVHVHHQIPVRQRHVLEALVPQDAGIVDQDVHGAELCDRIVDDGLRTFRGGHRGLVGDGDAASVANLRHGTVGHVAGAGAITGSTQIVHHHLRAARGELQRMGLAQAPACTGDNHHFIFEIAHLRSPCDPE